MYVLSVGKFRIMNVKWPYRMLCYIIYYYFFTFLLFIFILLFCFVFCLAKSTLCASYKHSLARWLNEWLTTWLPDCLTEWMVGRSTCLLARWPADRPNALIAALHVRLFPHRCVFFAYSLLIIAVIIQIYNCIKYLLRIFIFIFTCLFMKALARHNSH